MQSNADLIRLRLPIALDLAAAGSLLETVLGHLDAQPRLVVDASEVETLTLPCAQVLLAAQRSFERMSIERPSPAFRSALEDLGLDCSALCNAGVAEIAEQNVEPSQGGTAGPPAETAEETSMTKRILTIDDSKTIRDMLMLTLAEAGFEVLQAVDGQDGLDVLGKETGKVDVVITDINMPRMDGYEVIRQLRKNSAHRTTPILVLTTESETDKKNLAREAGATGWMVKPFDPDRLIATINKVAQ